MKFYSENGVSVIEVGSREILSWEKQRKAKTYFHGRPLKIVHENNTMEVMSKNVIPVPDCFSDEDKLLIQDIHLSCEKKQGTYIENGKLIALQALA